MLNTVKSLKKVANQGNADAQNSLGDMYYYGEGVTQNYAQAVKWLQKSANQGNADAQNSLGDMYYYGEGVTQNYAKAVEWYQKAANQGNAIAQYNLGVCYEEGNGITQSYGKAVEWYQKSANQENADAQNSLGDMYYYGEGVTQNYAQAVKWLQKSANQGNADAQNSLGDMYYYGEGVTQNYAQAVKWLQKSANQGNADAQNSLDNMYSDDARDCPSNAILTHYDNSIDNSIKDKQSSPPTKAYGYYACSCGSWWESAHSWTHETQDCKQCGEQVYPYRQEELQGGYDLCLMSELPSNGIPDFRKIYLEKHGHNKLKYVVLCSQTNEIIEDFLYDSNINIDIPLTKELLNKNKAYILKALSEKDHIYFNLQKPHREDLCGMCKKLGRSCTLEISASRHEKYPKDVVVKGLPMDINALQLRRQFSLYGTILNINIPMPKDDTNSRIAFITFENREEAIQRFHNTGQVNQKHKLKLR